LFTLVIAGPTLWWEEAWRGRPMIDQTGDLWVLPTVIVALAFFLGGAIAGRHRRRPAGALVQGVALALPTSVLLVVVDIARRSALHRGQSVGVAELWLAAIGGTVGIAALGALFGRWLYRLHEDRKSLVRHV
jgi:multisubunit Na+/H+ antiporter MnhB subunit